MQHTRLPHVQHTKYYSHVSYNCTAHEVLLACFLQLYSTRRWISYSAQNIARVLYMKVNSRVTRKFGLSHLIKIEEHMSVLALKCQLRRDLYCMCLMLYHYTIKFSYDYMWYSICNPWILDIRAHQLVTYLKISN